MKRFCVLTMLLLLAQIVSQVHSEDCSGGCMINEICIPHGRICRLLLDIRRSPKLFMPANYEKRHDSMGFDCAKIDKLTKQQKDRMESLYKAN